MILRVAEVVEGGEAVRAGLDVVFGLVQERADVADALVDHLGPNPEQGGDGDLRQGQAIVQDGGQEPVGQGEDGAAAGSLACLDAGAVGAAFVQAGFPLLVVQGHQRGDRGVPFRGYDWHTLDAGIAAEAVRPGAV